MLTTVQCTYPIAETFHSIQGEGAWSGSSAFFIRLAGCDVYCPWCDQKETWSSQRHPSQSVEELTRLTQNANPAIAVITGGEPLMHDLSALTRALRKEGPRLHLETSGAYPLTGQFDWITLSPKPYKPPHDDIYKNVNELKVVIEKIEDFLWAEEQAKRVSEQTLKYLQPEWNRPDTQNLVFEYILKHPQWRLSLQSHKYLGVR